MYEAFQGGPKLGSMMPRDANNKCQPLKPSMKLLSAIVGGNQKKNVLIKTCKIKNLNINFNYFTGGEYF